mmetsp:Transcript_18304/g.36852  ORF Transcript_18304/g.36852 Transcript_18304/m.36852 type:complete len:187 (+) Transcript_18304:245-805(+)
MRYSWPLCGPNVTIYALYELDDESDVIESGTVLYGHTFFTFCVSSSFLSKFRTKGLDYPLSLRNIREVTLPLLLYFLTHGAIIQELEGNCNMADIVEVSRRNTNRRKVEISRTTLQASPLISCRLEHIIGTVENALAFPELTFHLREKTCWPLLHTVLETPTVLDFTVSCETCMATSTSSLAFEAT